VRYLIFLIVSNRVLTLVVTNKRGNMSEVVNTHKLTFAVLAAMAVTLSVAMLVSSLATPVAAKIAPANCTNGGGQQPGGQQPVCNGGGLTQNPATNPSGNAPPGQQP
jgi:hypothetical protein